MKAALISILLLTFTVSEANEPKWLYPWQETVVEYLKTVKVSEVETKVKPVDVTKFQPGTELRHMYLASGYTPLLPFVARAVDLPADDFLWKNIWRPDDELFQPFLQDKHHSLKTGQFWIPAHPTTANLLAWAYSNKAEWNPYYNDKNVGHRAAIIAMDDLICWTENDYYYNDENSSYTGRRWGLHSAVTGFSLTFNAFTYLKTKDLLPEDVRKAWEEGLTFLCTQINKKRPTGPINMRFSVPVGMYYAWLGTKNPEIKKMYERWLGLIMFGPELSMAGYHWEGKGRAPDGSYYGIALHRMAELYSITGDKEILTWLRKAYTIKNYITLPMPDGQWVSPSHFNDRCADSFANDQYGGRETHFVCDVPESVPSLIHFRSNTTPKPIDSFEQISTTPNKRVVSAFPWGGGAGQKGRMHDWGMVLHLPDYMYHQDEAQIQQELAKKYTLPVLASDNFTRNFNNEFYCVRRPAYYAIFFTGPAVTSDNGTTNYRNMLKNQGGMFNGFSGGGLSSLWTPAGTFLIGRMTAYEDYERKEIDLGNRKAFIPGWQDWANNHLIGETEEGKILTSARTTWPKSFLDNQNNSLTIEGKIMKKLQRQEHITDAKIVYKRKYDFKPDSFSALLTISTDKVQGFKSLYETIPMHITEDLKIQFFGKDDKELNGAEKIDGVMKIILSREAGSLDIIFDKPETIMQVGKKIVSKRVVYCRNMHVALPLKLEPGKPVKLTYQLVPHLKSGMGMKQLPGALKYPPLPDLNVPTSRIMAHYSAAKGVEVNEKNEVVLWKDISENKYDLKPFQVDNISSAILKKVPYQAVVFDGNALLTVALKPEQTQSLTVIAVAKADPDTLETKNTKYGRIVSVVGEEGSDNTDGLVAGAYGLGEYGIQMATITKNFQRKPMKATAIGLGRMLKIKDGKLDFYSFGFQGEIMEVYIFNPAIPEGYQKIMKAELKKKYEIK